MLKEGNIEQDITLRDGDTVVIPTQDNIDITQTRLLSDANCELSANREINVAVEKYIGQGLIESFLIELREGVEN